MMPRAAVKAIRSHLPEQKLTNEDLGREFPDWGVEKIAGKTGIDVRGVSGPDECASDLAVAAAEKLFSDGVCGPEDVDFIILCTQSPDFLLPTTACIVQDRLGVPRTAGALDINLGCSGFVYSLALAKGLVETGNARCVLVLTTDTYTKHIHPQDRSVRTIFGDGAAATLVVAAEAEHDPIGPFVFGTDGSGAQNLIVPGGGTRGSHTVDMARMGEIAPGVPRSERDLYMNGPEIFTFTIQRVPAVVSELLAKTQLTPDDVDHYVFHQANAFMLEHLRKSMRIPAEKFCVNMQSYGNTVSATIPMALEVARNEGRILDGQRVLLVGFGVGYSWAATFITFV